MPIPTLAKKLEWLKPAPATAYEKECAAKVQQGDYEIGVQVTNDILDEAMEIFVRSSRSYFGVSGDSMVAIFTAGGDLINAACGTYLHAIIQPVVIKFILKYYAENPGIRDGDIWYTNDALYGGIHNPDQVALMPVFHNGKLIAWATAALHTTETGAIEPGGMPLSAKSRFDEGLNLPPIKIGENFQLRNDFLEFYSVYGLRAPRCSFPISVHVARQPTAYGFASLNSSRSAGSGISSVCCEKCLTAQKLRPGKNSRRFPMARSVPSYLMMQLAGRLRWSAPVLSPLQRGTEKSPSIF